MDFFNGFRRLYHGFLSLDCDSTDNIEVVVVAVTVLWMCG